MDASKNIDAGIRIGNFPKKVLGFVSGIAARQAYRAYHDEQEAKYKMRFHYILFYVGAMATPSDVSRETL